MSYDAPPPPPPDDGSAGGGYGQQPPPPPPPGVGYGQPGGHPQQARTSPLAIVSLVLGIVSILCCTWFVFGIGAVVTGHLGKKKIDESQGLLTGRGMAQAGFVLGLVTIVLGVVVWILLAMDVIPSEFNYTSNMGG